MRLQVTGNGVAGGYHSSIRATAANSHVSDSCVAALDRRADTFLRADNIDGGLYNYVQANANGAVLYGSA